MNSARYVEYMQKEAVPIKAGLGLLQKLAPDLVPSMEKALVKAAPKAAPASAAGAADEGVAAIMARFNARHPGGIPEAELNKLAPGVKSKVLSYIAAHPTAAKVVGGSAILAGGAGVSSAIAGEPLAGSEKDKTTAKEQDKPKTEVPTVTPDVAKDPLADKLNSSSMADYGMASLGGGLASGGIAAGISALMAPKGRRSAAARKGAMYGGAAGAVLSPLALLLANKMQSKV